MRLLHDKWMTATIPYSRLFLLEQIFVLEKNYGINFVRIWNETCVNK